jgi:hypothetical protein
VPGPREVAPLLWALATAQHPCTQDQLMTLVNALGWQQEGRHNHHHQHAAGESVGKSVGKASGKRVMDPGLVAMALMALPRLGCDPGPSRLAAAAAALQGRAGQLSTHTLCEVVAAFAELQVRLLGFSWGVYLLPLGVDAWCLWSLFSCKVCYSG